MGKKGLSAFNESTETSNRNNVQTMQMLDEIHETEDKQEEINEFDHRSDEEKNAEGYKSIIDEWKKQKGEQQDDSEVEVNTDLDDEPDDNSSESKEESEIKTEQKEEKAGDELPVIPKVLMDTALDLGIAPEEAQKMSISEITVAIDALKKVQPEKVEEEKEESEVDPLDEIKLDPDEYDEDIVKVVDTLKNIVKEVRDENK